MIVLLLACSSSTPAAPGGAEIAREAPLVGAAPRLVEVAKVAQPTAIVALPGTDDLLVVAQEGRIWRVTPGGVTTEVLDLSDRLTAGGERGLLGLAVHPRFPDDPRLFVNYTHTATAPGGDDQLRTRVASFRWAADRVDPASEVEVLGFDQPWGNHNSGALVFGADGYLYIAIGDGGSGGDPKGTGQRTDDWLGSILRVDVSLPPYTVPPDNPFVGNPDFRPEIWAYGVRNPWGMSADGPDLWFADVGQNEWEEVNRGRAGANFGWNIREGTHCYDARSCREEGLTPPVAEYPHSVGQSVTGGVVYRGPSVPALDGRYVYADYGTGVVFALPTSGGLPTRVMDTPFNPSSFGVDRQGRLYLGHHGGVVYRFEP